jgi:hypothetical protein
VLGMGAAWFDVFLGRKLCEANDCIPIRPDTKQTNLLADNVADGIRQTFGDREIGPWTMSLLLALAIPTSMLIQSPKKPPQPGESGRPESKPQPAKEPEQSSQTPEPRLRTEPLKVVS